MFLTVHGNARPVHEERPRLCAGLQHHSTEHLQRPQWSEGADTESEGKNTDD